VTFVGDVSNAKLPEFYNLCDLFVMANREATDRDIETFGMVFLEANAVGKAVVGGRSGGTADSILHGVTGFLVNSEDVDEIASVLRRLLTNAPLRRELGEGGLRRARDEFSWKSRAALLRGISREIVEAARSRGSKRTASELSIASPGTRGLTKEGIRR